MLEPYAAIRASVWRHTLSDDHDHDDDWSIDDDDTDECLSSAGGLMLITVNGCGKTRPVDSHEETADEWDETRGAHGNSQLVNQAADQKFSSTECPAVIVQISYKNVDTQPNISRIISR